MSTQETLLSTAHLWRSLDPNPAHAAETDRLIAEGGPAFAEAFGARLTFGTAGIRGRMGPGPGQMNRVLVRQVTAGLGRYLLATVPGAASRGVAVAGDARRNTADFVDDVVRVLGALGIRCHVHAGSTPTPVLAWSVVALEAAAGIMVTASHNPPEDNGYKVYWSNGAQVIPPEDEGIAAEIDNTAPASVELAEVADMQARGLWSPVHDDIVEDYVQAVLAMRLHTGHPIRAVYTAMHGVGYATLRRVLEAAGHFGVEVVPEQVEPDGNFPTVRFPNPEEKGALNLAFRTARAVEADIVIANDPDADRLAVAVPDRTAEGGWRQLTGNEVGLLLADDVIRHAVADEPRMVANTIVSTPMLGRIAEAHGAVHIETLTGFKWIANAGLAHTKATGGSFLMGFEEALGYTIGQTVRDKDGISAALLLLDLAGWCRSRGRTLRQHLDDLFSRYGVAGSGQRAITLRGAAGKERIDAVLAKLRASPPVSIAGRRVREWRDVGAGTVTDCQSGAVSTLDLPASDVLIYHLDGGARVIARPSGTEPKLKLYFDVMESLGHESVDTARDRALAALEALAFDFLDQTGLAPAQTAAT